MANSCLPTRLPIYNVYTVIKNAELAHFDLETAQQQAGQERLQAEQSLLQAQLRRATHWAALVQRRSKLDAQAAGVSAVGAAGNAAAAASSASNFLGMSNGAMHPFQPWSHHPCK